MGEKRDLKLSGGAGKKRDKSLFNCADLSMVIPHSLTVLIKNESFDLCCNSVMKG